MKRFIVDSMVLLLVTLGFGRGNSSLGAPVPTPRGELRIVDSHRYNFISIVFNVFEHLMELDHSGKLVPRLAGQFLNFHAGTRLEVIDPHTVRFIFQQPDGTALLKLSSMHIGNRQFYAEHGWGEKHW